MSIPPTTNLYHSSSVNFDIFDENLHQESEQNESYDAEMHSSSAQSWSVFSRASRKDKYLEIIQKLIKKELNLNDIYILKENECSRLLEASFTWIEENKNIYLSNIDLYTNFWSIIFPNIENFKFLRRWVSILNHPECLTELQKVKCKSGTTALTELISNISTSNFYFHHIVILNSGLANCTEGFIEMINQYFLYHKESPTKSWSDAKISFKKYLANKDIRNQIVSRLNIDTLIAIGLSSHTISRTNSSSSSSSSSSSTAVILPNPVPPLNLGIEPQDLFFNQPLSYQLALSKINMDMIENAVYPYIKNSIIDYHKKGEKRIFQIISNHISELIYNSEEGLNNALILRKKIMDVGGKQAVEYLEMKIAYFKQKILLRQLLEKSEAFTKTSDFQGTFLLLFKNEVTRLAISHFDQTQSYIFLRVFFKWSFGGSLADMELNWKTFRSEDNGLLSDLLKNVEDMSFLSLYNTRCIYILSQSKEMPLALSKIRCKSGYSLLGEIIKCPNLYSQISSEARQLWDESLPTTSLTTDKVLIPVESQEIEKALRETYIAVAKQWKEPQLQNNIRRLLRKENGNPFIDLSAFMDESGFQDVSEIRKILEPFIKLFSKNSNLEKFKGYRELLTLTQYYKNSPLGGLFEELDKNNQLNDGFLLTPPKYVTSVDLENKHRNLIGLSDITFLCRAKALETIEQRINSTENTISKCSFYLRFDRENVFLYPIRADFVNGVFIQFDLEISDGSATKLLFEQIMPTKENKRTDEDSFILTADESEQLIAYQKAHPTEFLIFSEPPEHLFAQEKSPSPQSSSQSDSKNLKMTDAMPKDRNPLLKRKRVGDDGQDISMTKESDSNESSDEMSTKKQRMNKPRALPGFVPISHDSYSDTESSQTPSPDRANCSSSSSSKLKSRAHQISSGNLLDDFMQQLNGIAEEKIQRCIELRKTNSDDALLSSTQNITMRLAKVANQSPIHPFEDTLKVYQKNAVDWILRTTDSGLGAVLASEPGLGKTRQAIEVIRQLQKRPFSGRPSLILVPGSLISQWHVELLTRIFEAKESHFLTLLNSKLSPDHARIVGKSLLKFYRSQVEQKELLLKKKGSLIDEKKINLMQQRVGRVENLLRTAMLRSETKEIFFNLPESKELQLFLATGWIEDLFSRPAIGEKLIGLKRAVENLRLTFAFTLKQKMAKAPLDPIIMKQILFEAIEGNTGFFMPLGMKSLETLYQALGGTYPTLQNTTIELDHSLLEPNMYEQVITYTTTSDKIQKEIAQATVGYKIILAQPSTLFSSLESKKNILATLIKLPFQAIFCDEAHKYNDSSAKNRLAKQMRELFHQLNGAPARILLTGTPFVNQFSDILSLLELANPGSPLNDFSNQLDKRIGQIQRVLNKIQTCTPEERPDYLPHFQTMLYSAFIAFEHAKMIQNKLLLIHSWQDPIVQEAWKNEQGIVMLPKKEEHVISCQLTEHQRLLIDNRDMKNFLTAEHYLQKVIAHPALIELWNYDSSKSYKEQSLKIREDIKNMSDERFDAFIKESGLVDKFVNDELPKSQNKPSLIIVNQLSQGALIQGILKRKFPGVSAPFFHGSKSLEERKRIVDTFQDGPEGLRFMILSIDAGGVGLDLKKAQIVFNLASWWNKATTDQAEARALRAGTSDTKQIYTFDCDTMGEAHMRHINLSKESWRNYLFAPHKSSADSLGKFLDVMKYESMQADPNSSKESWLEKTDELDTIFIGLKSTLEKYTEDEERDSRLKNLITLRKPTASSSSSSSSSSSASRPSTPPLSLARKYPFPDAPNQSHLAILPLPPFATHKDAIQTGKKVLLANPVEVNGFLKNANSLSDQEWNNGLIYGGPTPTAMSHWMVWQAASANLAKLPYNLEIYSLNGSGLKKTEQFPIAGAARTIRLLKIGSRFDLLVKIANFS